MRRTVAEILNFTHISFSLDTVSNVTSDTFQCGSFISQLNKDCDIMLTCNRSFKMERAGLTLIVSKFIY